MIKFLLRLVAFSAVCILCTWAIDGDIVVAAGLIFGFVGGWASRGLS